jgi:hypothetical protein
MFFSKRAFNVLSSSLRCSCDNCFLFPIAIVCYFDLLTMYCNWFCVLWAGQSFSLNPGFQAFRSLGIHSCLPPHDDVS